jgi:hypothetical protein
MARKTSKRNKTPSPRRDFQPQDVLFAGIGAASLGRKRLREACAGGLEGVASLRDRTQDALLVAVGNACQQVQYWARRA